MSSRSLLRAGAGEIGDGETSRCPDRGFVAIVVLVIGVAFWLIAMPFVPAIAATTMRRFHLRSGSFLSWAIQQPIPAMYNFANRYQVFHECPADWLESEAFPTEQSPLESGYVNHFPARMITFANVRYRLLRDRPERWYAIRSAYRGQELTTGIHVEPMASGELRMTHLPVRGSIP